MDKTEDIKSTATLHTSSNGVTHSGGGQSFGNDVDVTPLHTTANGDVHSGGGQSFADNTTATGSFVPIRGAASPSTMGNDSVGNYYQYNGKTYVVSSCSQAGGVSYNFILNEVGSDGQKTNVSITVPNGNSLIPVQYVPNDSNGSPTVDSVNASSTTIVPDVNGNPTGGSRGKTVIYQGEEWTIYDYNDNGIKLEDFFKNVSFHIDNYKRSCKKYNKNSLYLLIDATDSDDNVTSYRVPLSLTDSCSAQP